MTAHRIATRLLVASTLLLLPAAATAQGTRLWTQSRADEFERGTAEGVAIASDGSLSAGPGLVTRLTTPSTTVWSVAAAADGTAYLGTGAPATVLRVTTDGKSSTLFESHELTVQAVALGPDGALYAATMPAGRIYRLNPASTEKSDEQKAALVFDLGARTDSSQEAAKDDAAPKDAKTARYIWQMTFDREGRLLVATGNPAAVWRIDLKSDVKHPHAEKFFASDEAHLRSLAWDAAGNLIAGSDGSGLVYRISAEGKGYVLFEAPRREITALAIGDEGTIYAASVGDKSRNPLPRLEVQGQNSGSIVVLQVGSAQAANQSASIPEGSEIWALKDGQAPRRLWAGREEIVYALAATGEGLLAATGNRGRLLRIAPDGSWSDLGHLPAQQGLAMAATADRVLIATGNTGKLIELAAAAKHEYASDVLDAGAMARFGRVELEPGAEGVKILTRSGNVEQPVRGWSEWQPLADGRVASPAGRFFEWKAVLEKDGKLGGVGVNYLPVNAAPVVDEIVVVPGARWTAQPAQSGQPTVQIAFADRSQNAAQPIDAAAAGPLQAVKDRTAVTARWAAHDDNGDELSFSVYLRGDSESVWRLLKTDLADRALSFDATELPDGGYQLKVVASDAPSHTPADVLKAEKVSERFELDTTAPVIAGLKVQRSGERAAEVGFEAEDAFSPLARAEYSIDAGPWQYLEPVGGLSDARHERYQFKVEFPQLDAAAEHLIAVRVFDRHDNAAVSRAVVPAKTK